MARQDFKCTVRELEALIDQYFTECDEAGKSYSEAGLCYHIGLPLARYKYLMDIAYAYTTSRAERERIKREAGDDSIQWGHLEVLALQVLRIADQLSRRSDKMALTQVRYARLGGYDDKPAKAGEDTGPVKVELFIAGIQEGSDPFG